MKEERKKVQVEVGGSDLRNEQRGEGGGKRAPFLTGHKKRKEGLARHISVQQELRKEKRKEGRNVQEGRKEGRKEGSGRKEGRFR